MPGNGSAVGNDGTPGAMDVPPVIVQRDDGVWFLAGAAPAACREAAARVFLSGACFAGLDYGIFSRMLYGVDPAVPTAPAAQAPVRFADAVVPFPPARRALYKSVKIVAGEAAYFFEPVFLDSGNGAPVAATLTFDEFVADLWDKGIRFGIDAAAVRGAIAAGKPARIAVARRLAPVPGHDATIVEVSRDMHRSNAPRELANGRFDLHTFQNRFPQAKAQTRLLRKEPRTGGRRGHELSGLPIEPPVARDIELTHVAGPGTVIEHIGGFDYVIAAVDGYINVDRNGGRVSIGPKVVGREGVSARTTGNLQLTGEYEEFGEVQENRFVEGGNITIHGDVFGHVASRGGTVLLKRNLMGGTVVNAAGAIHVGGVAANAVLQAPVGEVTIRQAQNCVITAAKVTIGEASNCEIMAGEVTIGIASGCAIAGRTIALETAGPRKGSEMLLFALVADTRRHEEAIAGLAARVAQLEAAAAGHKAAVDGITGRPDVRSYLALAASMRAREVTLTAVQLAQLQKLAAQVGPALKDIAEVSQANNAVQAQLAQARDRHEQACRRRDGLAAAATCKVKMLAGDTVLRTMMFQPDAGPPCDLAPKEVRAKLRAGSWNHPPVLDAADGALDWSSAP